MLETLCSGADSTWEVKYLSRRRKDMDMDRDKGKTTVQEAGKKGGSRARELGEEDRESTER